MLRRLVENHVAYTGSDRARELLDSWETAVESFTRVMPDAYAAVISDRTRDDIRRQPPASATPQEAGDAVQGSAD
ncbi:MAG: hypothetical protein J07HX5_00241 [halophilic archaeon J07HX5]|nr:MAG: hypothetical protein J07HX5_00241 [halophilic archaeon J07HX5]